MTDAESLPPAAVMLRSTIADFDTWKAVFDENEEMRRAGGIVAHHINRSDDDPSQLAVYFAVADVDAAKAFLASDDLKQVMAKAGLQGPPEVTWMTPVREEAVWDRELPGMIVSHSVADFDSWLEGYDATDGLRQSNGIVGHAANRLIDDPSVVLVYHQAESADTLRAFLDNPDLREAMDEAGVTSEPEVSFHTGGWAKAYD